MSLDRNCQNQYGGHQAATIIMDFWCRLIGKSHGHEWCTIFFTLAMAEKHSIYSHSLGIENLLTTWIFLKKNHRNERHIRNCGKKVMCNVLVQCWLLGLDRIFHCLSYFTRSQQDTNFNLISFLYAPCVKSEWHLMMRCHLVQFFGKVFVWFSLPIIYI